MPCGRCASRNQSPFLSETSVHFRDPKDLTRSPIMIFPVLTVCLDCGLAEFEFPKEELRCLTATELSEEAAASGEVSKSAQIHN